MKGSRHTMNGFFFFWLIFFAVIGLLFTLAIVASIFFIVYSWMKDERQERQEYEEMKKSLLRHFEKIA